MRSLVFSLAAAVSATTVLALALASSGCGDVPVLPEYLGVLDGGPAKPASSVFPLKPDAATPFPSGTLTACAAHLPSTFGALSVASGAAYAGGDVFVAAGEGVRRLVTDASGCPLAPSGATFATSLAPVRTLAISGGALWAAGSTSVAIVGSLGEELATCTGPGASGVTSLAAIESGGVVGASVASSLTFFSRAADGGCVAQSAEITRADGASFGPVSAVATDGSLVWMTQLDHGVAQVQSGRRSADGVTVTIDMPLAPLTDACSADALAVLPGPDALPHLLVADDTCLRLLEYSLDPVVTLVSSTPMPVGHAVRAFAAVPGSPHLLAVSVAPAGSGAVVTFDVLALPLAGAERLGAAHGQARQARCSPTCQLIGRGGSILEIPLNQWTT